MKWTRQYLWQLKTLNIEIQALLEQLFPKKDYIYTTCAMYNNLDVSSFRDDTRIYIRILPFQDSLGEVTGCYVDIANIMFAEHLRGHGLFREMVEGLSELPGVKQVCVSTVLSKGMHAACHHLGMEWSNKIMGYTTK